MVLKHPNQYIPQFMEDLADMPLVLHMGDQSKTVAIEVTNIKSYKEHNLKVTNVIRVEGIKSKDGRYMESIKAETEGKNNGDYVSDCMRGICGYREYAGSRFA